MKRLSTGVLAALLATGFGLNAVAAPAASHGNIGTNAIAQAGSMAGEAPPANFGSPPSGQIPILFNDHHVYAKPDTLKQGRVLAALVRGGTILIPLRSMFEQMGATVAYDPSTKSVDVSKPGADVKITVGKPEVSVNGDTRPLDVPPIIWQGQVLVPIRVLSEAMGAYVEWVPDKKLVAVRYVVPTPPPTPTPTEAPTAPPPPTPTPTPVATPYHDLFVVGDYIASPKVYNEFSPGNVGSSTNGGFSYDIRGAAEFNLANLPWMVEGDFRQINYPHNCASASDPQCFVAVIGPVPGAVSVPAFTARDYSADARIGIRVLNPRIYIGIGYLALENNYGYPRLTNVGFGIEKLPDLNTSFSVHGYVYYYPNVKGNFTDPSGNLFQLAYNVLKFNVGIDYSFQNSPLFIDAGYLGDGATNKSNAPAGLGFLHVGPFAGIGLKF